WGLPRSTLVTTTKNHTGSHILLVNGSLSAAHGKETLQLLVRCFDPHPPAFRPTPGGGASAPAENDRRPQRRARSLARSSRPGRVPEGPADTARHACLAQPEWV